jgi:hypothetical protein
LEAFRLHPNPPHELLCSICLWLFAAGLEAAPQPLGVVSPTPAGDPSAETLPLSQVVKMALDGDRSFKIVRLNR